MLKIIPIKAFNDNYIWLIANYDRASCIVVDPGDARPAIDFIRENHLQPEAIMITHHHHDHCGGIEELKRLFKIPAYGPDNSILGLDHILSDKQEIYFPRTDVSLEIIGIPGHTLSHLGFYGNESLFTGDTLFSAGCGRLFEGTPAQMLSSLTKLMQYPPSTKIYCGHEYTKANLKFAQVIEPNNQDVKKHLDTCIEAERQGLPTLPSTLKIESLINPFLRTSLKTVIDSVKENFALAEVDQITIFQKLREWKNSFS